MVSPVVVDLRNIYRPEQMVGLGSCLYKPRRDQQQRVASSMPKLGTVAVPRPGNSPLFGHGWCGKLETAGSCRVA